MRHRIAIIGGGTSALYLLRAFVHEANVEVSLTIFEAGDRLGVGMPYSPEWSNPEHQMNIASQELPELHEEPHEWLLRQSDEFLARHGVNRSEITPLYILPRILFGIYQEEQFEALMDMAADRNLQVDAYTHSRVTYVEDSPEQNTVRLTINHQTAHEFERVIISTGHEWPTIHEGTIEGYFDSPYPLRKVSSIQNIVVGIIGSSLSSVDAIRTLARANGLFQRSESGRLEYQVHQNCENFRVVMHSRRGLLPSIRYHLEHPRIRQYEYISLEEIQENIQANNGFLSLDYVFEVSYLNTVRDTDPETYAVIRNMSIEQFVEYYYQREGMQSAEPFRLFEEQLGLNRITEQTQTPTYWKEAIEDTVYTLNFHAKSLSAEDTIRLRRYLMPLYYHAVIFMPYDSCEEILALHRAGRLEIVTLGFESRVEVDPHTRGATFHFLDENRGECQLHYDVVIDCRGQRQLPFESFPFRNLADEGVVVPARIRFQNSVGSNVALPEGCSVELTEDESYLHLPGIAINDNFQVIGNNGESNPRLYVVANAHIKGMNPDLSGIPFCNDSAIMVMRSIVQPLCHPYI